jgi:hypothetical protein
MANDFEGPSPRRRPDSKVEEAKVALRAFFEANPAETFYLAQLEVLFEKKFFHWITNRALEELVDLEYLRTERLAFGPAELRKMIVSLSIEPDSRIAPLELRFYRLNSTKSRYSKRRALAKAKFVAAYSRSSMTHGLGPHGEMMVDAALSTVGFTVKAKDVREWNGRKWIFTDNDLDRIYERDGDEYGAEIKNTLAYIDKELLLTKLSIAKFFDVRPLFIVRRAPQNYIEMVRKRGGFTLILDYQLYPFGFRTLAKKVQAALGLPVDSPPSLADQTAKRFLDWHYRRRRIDRIRAYLKGKLPGAQIGDEPYAGGGHRFRVVPEEVRNNLKLQQRVFDELMGKSTGEEPLTWTLLTPREFLDTISLDDLANLLEGSAVADALSVMKNVLLTTTGPEPLES